MKLFVVKYSQEVIILKKNNYKPNEFAELINVSLRTLQRWNVEGKRKVFKTPINRRYDTQERYLKYKVFIKRKVIERLFYLHEIREDVEVLKPTNEGIGIDLGIKDFVVCSDGTIFKNINKTSTVKKVEKKLKREQRKLSRKYESLKMRNKNIEEGRATQRNIQKQVVKVQKLHQRLVVVVERLRKI